MAVVEVTVVVVVVAVVVVVVVVTRHVGGSFRLSAHALQTSHWLATPEFKHASSR